jgi:hypothetical protein
MKIEELTKQIIEGDYTSQELESVYNAYSSAIKLLRSKEKAVALATVKSGMIGFLKNLKPLKYVGMKVVVTKVNKSRVMVKEADKDYAFEFTVPANCIDFA